MSTLGAIFAETESYFCYVILDIPIRPTERYIISEYEINFTWGELVQSRTTSRTLVVRVGNKFGIIEIGFPSMSLFESVTTGRSDPEPLKAKMTSQWREYLLVLFIFSYLCSISSWFVMSPILSAVLIPTIRQIWIKFRALFWRTL